MRFIFFVVSIVLISIRESEEVENWQEVNKEICKTDHPSEKQQEIEKCLELDMSHKLDVS
jgi:hypothetical protein